MNKQWLEHNNNSKLILFFNGWGMDESAIQHVDSKGFDLLMFNDYTELKLLNETFDSYTEIYVVAWSMGVWAASHVLDKSIVKITKAIAINGTQTPIDNNLGIPHEIFKGTLLGWAGKTRQRFFVRITGGVKEYLKNQEKFGSRSVEDQKLELNAIHIQNKTFSKSDFTFDEAIIGNQDAIFVSKNQLNSWENMPQIQTVDMPHYPFFHFSSWEQIVSN